MCCEKMPAVEAWLNSGGDDWDLWDLSGYAFEWCVENRGVFSCGAKIVDVLRGSKGFLLEMGVEFPTIPRQVVMDVLAYEWTRFVANNHGNPQGLCGCKR